MRPKKNVPPRDQIEGPAATIYELGDEFSLNLLYRLADGRLGDVEFLRRFAETSLASDFTEDAEGIEIHGAARGRCRKPTVYQTRKPRAS